jgi:hypothetical protein
MSAEFRFSIPPGRTRLTRAARCCGGVLCALASGVLACNSLLGIREASLRCDTNPCTTEVAGATAGVAGEPGASVAGEAPLDDGPAGNGAGAGGAASETGIGGAPALLQPSGNSGSALPESGSSAAGAPEGSAPSSGGAAGAGGGAAVDAGAPQVPSGSGGAPAALCSSSDACGVCICNECGDEFAACTETPGCVEIVACARLNGCAGFDCYCGSMDPITCVTSGPGNGACVEATLAAPGSHVATLNNPSAGPASDAALALANCSARNDVCTAACQN